jgi:hypothetical protein
MTPHEFQELVESLERTPAIIERLVDGLADEDLRWKPSEKAFSVLEQVCHLRDIEQEGYTVRINKLLNEDQPFLPDLDGDKLAVERNYNGQNLDAALAAFRHARRENSRTLSEVALSQLTRSGVFENVGTVSLESLLVMMRDHDQGHIKDLSTLRDQLVGVRI